MYDLKLAKSQFHKYADSPYRKFQEEAIRFALESEKKIVVLEAATGCHEPNQKILMADGSIKKAKNISVGDLLINEYGEFLSIQKLISGYGKMYEIFPVKGKSWVVNEDHILTLKKTNMGAQSGNTKNDGQIINVSVKDWFGWSKTKKHIFKLVRIPVKKFKNQEDNLPIDAYLLGVLLGDGTTTHGNVGFSTADFEILDYMENYAEENNLKIRQGTGNPYTFYFTKKENIQKHNELGQFSKTNKIPIRISLEKLAIAEHKSGTKFIPQIYKTSSWDSRRKILAGLIDTDGSVDRGGIDYISKSKQLAEDVTFVARSLGLAAYMVSCKKGCQNGFVGDYFRVSISGNCEIIPCLIKRKQCKPRLQKKKVTVTGFKIEEIGEGEFYGWQLDCNGRYLLDDFTLTHNSGKSLIGLAIGAATGSLSYLVHTKILQNQITSDFPEARSLFGRSNYDCKSNSAVSCDECSSTKESPCLYKKTLCNYELRKREVLAAKYRIMNYDYYLSECNFVGKFSGAPLVVIDEADSLENTLINFTSLQFSSYALRRMDMLGWAEELKMTSKDKSGLLESWCAFGLEAKSRVSEVIKHISGKIDSYGKDTDRAADLIKERARVTRLKGKIELFLDNVDTDWVLDNQDGSKLTFRPLWMTQELAEDFLWRHGEKFVLMSASFYPKPILAKCLGIDTNDMDYYEVPSQFPVKNRPVYVCPAANMTAKTTDVELPKLVSAVSRIVNAYPDVKGIIHAVSYKLAQSIMSGVNNPRLITHNSTDRQDVIDNFIASTKPLILVSPSLERGISLDEDKARLVIIIKAPYLYLGDKIVSARLYSSKIGNAWYTATMLLTILQMSGRAVRSKDDTADTYILDLKAKEAIQKNPTFLPLWWLEALEFELPARIGRISTEDRAGGVKVPGAENDVPF